MFDAAAGSANASAEAKRSFFMCMVFGLVVLDGGITLLKRDDCIKFGANLTKIEQTSKNIFVYSKF